MAYRIKKSVALIERIEEELTEFNPANLACRNYLANNCSSVKSTLRNSLTFKSSLNMLIIQWVLQT